MSAFEDVMLLEDGTEDKVEYYSALQRMINAGRWGLQGSFGRTMMSAIESGMCMLGTNAAADYYGNRIPSRTMVMEGTKGSRQFVADCQGEEWAKMMEAA